MGRYATRLFVVIVSIGAVAGLTRPAVAGLQTAAATPGFTLTFDGDVLKNETFVIKPLIASSANNFWRSSRDPRVD